MNAVTATLPPEILGARWITNEEECILEAAFLALPNGQAELDAMRFALYTGCRFGEQLDLQPRHVRGEELHINGRQGVRVIPLSTAARDIAQAQIDRGQLLGSKWLFWPERADRSAVLVWHRYKVWLPATRAAGLEGLRWRDLRHTFAHRLLQELPAEDVLTRFDVGRLLGHTK